MEKRKSSINEKNNIVHMSNQRKRKANIEISPDSEKFEKYLKEFNFYLNENKKNEKILIQILQGFLEDIIKFLCFLLDIKMSLINYKL